MSVDVPGSPIFKAGLLSREVVPFLLSFAALVATALLFDALLHLLDAVWVGRYLGIPGTLIILFSFGYSLRKRGLIKSGSPVPLLRLHERMGWAGAMLVLVHAGIHFNAVLGWLAICAMLVNVASGLTGKFLLQRSRRRLEETKQQLLDQGVGAEEVEHRLYWDSFTVGIVKKWRVVHFPIALAFAVLATAHIVAIFVLWGVEVTGRRVLILVAMALIVPLALTFAYPRWMASPGSLQAYHAELADNCFACHKPFRGASSERCIACHAVEHIGLQSTKGVPLARGAAETRFHQALIEQDCVTCHVAHESPHLAQSEAKRFAHDLLRPETRDRCESCHAAPQDGLHRSVPATCGRCHKPDDWKPATFDHAKHFVLDGDHDTACATCHVGDDVRRYTCYGCHAHRPDEIRAKHLEEGVRAFENCVRCHRSASDEPGEGRERD